jgi:DNA-binding NarL/FixJ family response regulator
VDSQGVVLVVDGDRDSRVEIAASIGELGYGIDTVATAAEARRAVRSESPALVVLDIDLPGATGYEICRELRDQFGESLPIVFVSATRTESRDQVAGLLLGADAYVAKNDISDLLVAYVRRLLARAVPRSKPAGLTRRELEVLRLLVDGLRPAEIAEQLCITGKTTATHIERILMKLGAHSQAQAVAFAVRDRLIPAKT